MNESYFQHAGGALAPESRSHAPWGEDMLHGRLLGALAARAIENEFCADGWRAARLSVDLFRPAAMAPVTVTAAAIRQGRKVQVVDADLHCDGHHVGRATAVLLIEGEQPPGRVWRPARSSWPDPDSLTDAVDDAGEAIDSEWKFRTVAGGFETGVQSRVWTKDTIALVGGEAVTPFVRAALSGDIACPLANSGDEGLFYINADYTMLIGRYPVGEWIGVEVSEQIEADGISIASSLLADRHGPFATSGGTSVARPPLQMGA